MGNQFKLTPVQSQNIPCDSLIPEWWMSSANYYLAQAFSPMLKFQKSAERKSKTISIFIYSSRPTHLQIGKEETTANVMCIINLKSFFLHAFCTPRHSLNLAYQEEFTQGTVLLISIRSQGKQFSREDAHKTHAFLTIIWLRTEL